MKNRKSNDSINNVIELSVLKKFELFYMQVDLERNTYVLIMFLQSLIRHLIYKYPLNKNGKKCLIFVRLSSFQLLFKRLTAPHILFSRFIQSDFRIFTHKFINSTYISLKTHSMKDDIEEE